MRFKIVYRDSDDRDHTRYYSALNVPTVKEMFNATVSHSFGDKYAEVVDILRLNEETHQWESIHHLDHESNVNEI